MKPIGHQHVLDRFAGCLAAGRLASTWLFTGMPGVGKLTTARYIAGCLLCERSPPGTLEFCGECPACHLFAAGNHPDILEVHRPVDENKNLIPLELLIGDKENRSREGLCHDLALSPIRGKYRIGILNDADFLNQEGANALLKTLEEPPPRAVIFLIGTSEHQQLPTIRSRCQIVRFRPLPPGLIRQILGDQPEWMAASPEQMEEVSMACGGSLQTARDLQAEGVMVFREELFQRLASLDPTDENFFETTGNLVDQAGTVASAKRDRMRLVGEMAIQLYRHAMLLMAGQAPVGDPSVARHAAVLAQRLEGKTRNAAACIERCVQLRTEIAANANQALMIECWLSDLGRLMRGEFVGSVAD
jgi:DNA polymerase III subunit delta'